jgi:hypothetical protein
MHESRMMAEVAPPGLLRHAEGERQQDGDAVGAAQARQHADDHAEDHPGEHEREVLQRQRDARSRASAWISPLSSARGKLRAGPWAAAP